MHSGAQDEEGGEAKRLLSPELGGPVRAKCCHTEMGKKSLVGYLCAATERVPWEGDGCEGLRLKRSQANDNKKKKKKNKRKKPKKKKQKKKKKKKKNTKQPTKANKKKTKKPNPPQNKKKQKQNRKKGSGSDPFCL